MGTSFGSMLHMAGLGLAGLVIAACAPIETRAPQAEWRTLDGEPTAIIAHRGASGLRPEHTLAAYDLAIDQGADWIEPDLVMTKDGIIVCRHDRYLSTTTDVATRPEFADRRTTKTSGLDERDDWWVEDFTLAELKTLRAVQPRADRPQDLNGRFEIPTFEEVIALAKARSTPERVIGVVPETKSPGAFSAMGLDMEAPLLASLEKAGWRDEAAPIQIQSFEPGILKSLNAKTDVRLVQLAFVLEAGGLLRPNLPLEPMRAYADGVGPQKELVVSPDGTATDYIDRAHALGLAVYPWTLRDDQPPADGAGPEAEFVRMFALGADGVFTDFPATGVKARAAWQYSGTSR